MYLINFRILCLAVYNYLKTDSQRIAMHKFQILYSYCPQNLIFLDVCYHTPFQYPKSESR